MSKIYAQLNYPILGALGIGVILYFMVDSGHVALYHFCQILLMVPAFYYAINLSITLRKVPQRWFFQELFLQEKILFSSQLSYPERWLRWFGVLLIPISAAAWIGYSITIIPPWDYGMVLLVAVVFIGGMLPKIKQYLHRPAPNIWITEAGISFFINEYKEALWDDIWNASVEKSDLLIKMKEAPNARINIRRIGRNQAPFFQTLTVMLEKHSIPYDFSLISY